ncbi:MAG TPA: hypothetical protein VIN33_11035 [Marinobacter sp.]
MRAAMFAALALAGASPVLAVNDPQQYTNMGNGDWRLDINTSVATGSITFNDWGYTGPTGVGVNDFEVAGGFDASRLGQVQRVTTLAPDYLTPDPASGIWRDGFGYSPPNPQMPNANMDGSVNFYRWGYTTPESHFNNMHIDTAGNYFVGRDSMRFGFYDTFAYTTDAGATTSDWDTQINFQPYAISDGIGWCGSTMVANPNGLETMAGQITFDFAFDAYLFDGLPGVDQAAPQLVAGFVMRSYGDYSVDVTHTPTGRTMAFEGSAVGNNMDPLSVVPGEGGTTDADYLNKVSFLGAGVVPPGVWVTADSFDENGNRVLNEDGTWQVTIVPEGTEGAVYHSNDFAGYAFLLRADAERTLEWINPLGHSDYVVTDPAAYDSLSAVPVPPAVWLLGSGLMGLLGWNRRRNVPA